MDNKLLLIIASVVMTAMCGFIVWWVQRITVMSDERNKAITSLELMVTSDFAKAAPNIEAHKELWKKIRELETQQIKQASAMKLLDPKFIAFFGEE